MARLLSLGQEVYLLPIPTWLYLNSYLPILVRNSVYFDWFFSDILCVLWCILCILWCILCKMYILWCIFCILQCILRLVYTLYTLIGFEEIFCPFLWPPNHSLASRSVGLTEVVIYRWQVYSSGFKAGLFHMLFLLSVSARGNSISCLPSCGADKVLPVH